MIRKATASAYSMPIGIPTRESNGVISTTMPIRNPPSTAPYTEPIPPRITAANTTNRRLNPIRGLNWLNRPRNAPPAPASPAPMTHDQSLTR